MKKLTAQVARMELANLKALNAHPSHGISIKAELFMQALEIALPVLEQKEVKSILLSDYKCDDDLVYPMYECSDCQLRHLPEERRPSQQVSQTKCPRCECLQFKRHIVDHRDPDERPTDTYRQIENDDWIEWGGGDCPVKKGEIIEIKLRDGCVYRGDEGDAHILIWQDRGLQSDIIAYRVIENDGREG